MHPLTASHKSNGSSSAIKHTTYYGIDFIAKLEQTARGCNPMCTNIPNLPMHERTKTYKCRTRETAEDQERIYDNQLWP